jgi:quinol-cytochrome oxidoreductase complex cytochrome b subunit
MRAGWVGRIGVLAAVIAPVALVVDCGFRLYFEPWRPTYVPGWCAVNRLLASRPSMPEMLPCVYEWYLLPVYAMRRSFAFDIGPIDGTGLGDIVVSAAFAAPLSLAFWNWRTTPRRAWLSLLGAGAIVLALGWTGAQPPKIFIVTAGQVLTVVYFLIFVVVFPLLARARKRV